MGEIIPLDKTNTVLTRHCTLHFNSLLDHAVHHGLSLWSLGVVIQKDSVEVAITDMSYNGGKQAALCHVLLGCLNQIWQLAHRHSHITGPDVVTGLLDSHGAPKSLLSRTPKLVLLLLALGELEGLATSL